MYFVYRSLYASSIVTLTFPRFFNIKIGGQEGMIAALLQIIASENVDMYVNSPPTRFLAFFNLDALLFHSATRQAAAVYLKNRVYSTYFVETVTRPDQTPIAPSDRDALKSSILHLISISPNRPITLQLANTLKNIVARDFPENWPNLLENVKNLLASNNVREVGAGCVAALEIVRAFR